LTTASDDEIDAGTSEVEAQLIPWRGFQRMDGLPVAPLSSFGKLFSTPKGPTPLDRKPPVAVIITGTQSSPRLGSFKGESELACRQEMDRHGEPSLTADIVPHLKHARSSPQLAPSRRAFDVDNPLPPLDRAFQEAEAKSSFTQTNTCVVCEKDGVNFPRCRNCDDTFCSRECRVGTDAGGNGTK
jgi:hypothetical protein